MLKKIVNIALMLFALSLAGVAHAVPVDSNSIESCLLGGGDSTSETTETFTCCTRVDRWYETCRTCMKEDKEACRTSTTWNPEASQDVPPRPERPTLLDQLKQPQSIKSVPAKPVAPSKPSISRDQLKLPQATKSAPAKAVVPSKRPTVKPIKQYTPISASEGR